MVSSKTVTQKEKFSSQTEPAEQKQRMPHVYVILFIFIVIASLLTYIVPAGVYERVPGPEGRTTIDPSSYQIVESSPIGLTDFMLAIPKGLAGAAEVVFLH
ncbi:hypothetical protein [Jeotgalibacillus soli]|uniref:C4-dicarboxylate ABC transporter n=1 Tax=Jeotgalibacillus soli TaxID=889306 RepID=A0A0C2W5T6_9BACL|nr:C4-dicarboxylate ABC transporter [Jeotgalibacillus soli]